MHVDRQLPVFFPLLSLALALWLLLPAFRPSSEAPRASLSDPPVSREDESATPGREKPGQPVAAPEIQPRVTASAAAPGQPGAEAAPANWWAGKEDLRRKLEREKYFSGPEEREEEIVDAAELAKAKAEFIFKEFRGWARRYRYEKDAAKRRELLAEGTVRATIRRPHMTDLMLSDPRAALKASLPLAHYAALPEEVKMSVERPFSEIVTIRPAAGRENHSHEIVFPGEAAPLASTLFGRRAGCGFKSKCPVQGIRLDGAALVREEVMQVLRGDDLPGVETLFDPPLANADPQRCFASGNALGPRRARALAGGMLFVFESARALHEFSSKIRSLDELPGEVAGSGMLFVPEAPRDAGGGFDFAAAERAWGSSTD